MNTNTKPLVNMFPGLKDAKVSNKSAYLRPGKYKVRVKKAVYIPIRAGGDAFILEFTVEHSNYEDKLAEAVRALNGQPYNLAELNKTLPNKIGESASWFQSTLDKAVGWGSIKGFAANVNGVDPESQDFIENVENWVSAVVQHDALNGALLPVDVINVKTKAGGDFSRHNWSEMIEPPGSKVA